MSDFPDPNTIPADPKDRWKKHEVKAYYATLSGGQKEAFNEAVIELRDWLRAPVNGWFGKTLNASVINGKIKEYAEENNCAPGPMTYNAYRWLENEL